MSQLFTVRRMNVPHEISFTDEGDVKWRTIERFPFVRWPDNSPCELVNMYLLDLPLTTGSSLATYASELSPLIRFCAESHLSFFDLNDKRIDIFSAKLINETRQTSNGKIKTRNNNTTITILKRTIHFLLWIQKNFSITGTRNLIGEVDSAPRIKISQKKMQNPLTKKLSVTWTHRSFPPPATREPKSPIALEIIEDIEVQIDRIYEAECTKASNNKGDAILSLRLLSRAEYIRSRRHFMIWLMKRTGLRPAELIQLDLQSHKNILRDKALFLPTMKRRRDSPPIRRFDIKLQDAAIFLRYVASREKFIQATTTEYSGHALLLGIDGKDILKTSIERDFHRLVIAAGHSDDEACFSMFRHRFITYEVVIHLKEFMDKSGKSQHLMTDLDYLSILKRVAKKTGHGRPESLLHYIDLAWKELDVWTNVDRALERLHAADRLFEELLQLRTSILHDRSKPALEVLEAAITQLSSILAIGRSAFAES
jgi:hypothetical protein